MRRCTPPFPPSSPSLISSLPSLRVSPLENLSPRTPNLDSSPLSPLTVDVLDCAIYCPVDSRPPNPHLPSPLQRDPTPLPSALNHYRCLFLAHTTLREQLRKKEKRERAWRAIEPVEEEEVADDSWRWRLELEGACCGLALSFLPFSVL